MISNFRVLTSNIFFTSDSVLDKTFTAGGEGRGVVGGRDGAEADYCALDDLLVYWRGWSEIDNT